MLGKTSVSMMVLLVAASLIGIAGILQYEGQTLPAAKSQPQEQLAQKAKVVTGKVTFVTMYASSAGKVCIAVVQLPSDKPNNLKVEPGTAVELLAPNESFCTLFGLSKIGNTQIFFNTQKVTASSLPASVRADLMLPDYEYIYRVTRVDI